MATGLRDIKQPASKACIAKRLSSRLLRRWTSRRATARLRAVHWSRLAEPFIGPRFARTRWRAPPATNGKAVCAGMTLKRGSFPPFWAHIGGFPDRDLLKRGVKTFGWES